MCIAVAGKVIQINDTRGKVDISGNILDVELGIVAAKEGDYVLVHAGCAISVIDKTEAEELQALMKLLDEYDE